MSRYSPPAACAVARRLGLPQGFSEGEVFFVYLRDALDVLYAGGEERPKLLNIGSDAPGGSRPSRRRLPEAPATDDVPAGRAWPPWRVAGQRS